MVETREAMMQARADVRQARKDYRQTLRDAESDLVSASTKSDALAAAMVDSRKVVLNLKNTVVFDVLGAEQRNAGIRCMAKIHRMKKMKKMKMKSKSIQRLSKQLI